MLVQCSSKMGTGNSKEFDRASPRRKSRRKFYGVLKHNFDLIEHKLKPERLSDEEYDFVQQLINASKNDLLSVAADVESKPKYKPVYDECMAKCDRFAEELRGKRIPSSAPSSPGPKKRRKKKLRKDQRKSLLTPEEESFAAIHAIRAEMGPLRDEVLTFKGAKDDRIYHFLQESFHRYVKKLCAIELHDRVQLKYELRIAIAYAQESQEVLDQICAGIRPASLRSQHSVDESRVASLNTGNGSPTSGHFVKHTTVMRNRSKSMGDYLHKTGDEDFRASKKSFPKYPDSPDYSSDSDYAQTSDFSDGPNTPHSIKSTFTYNFKVTSI